MDAYRKFRKLISQTETDEEYLALEKARCNAEKKFYAVLEALPEAERDSITEYLGILQEQELRLLELSCFQ